jgi:serine/threonine-protein phosphatase PP1 catalytic subunit
MSGQRTATHVAETSASNSIHNILQQLLPNSVETPLRNINLNVNDIIALLHASRELFMSEPVLLKIDAPINICGDIHGQYYDLLRVFENEGTPPNETYLFMGDYVDRGKFSIEVMCLLLALKYKFPKHVHLLRGNHESAAITKQYGFYDECKRRYNVKLWKTFVDVFNTMPIAAVVAGKVFCVHGGLSPDLTNVDDILKIKRPLDIPDDGIVCDLLWSDPDTKHLGWSENDRGVSYLFGKDCVENFLSDNNLELICRAHEVVEEGYQFAFGRKLITVFTAPSYMGEFDNAGAVLKISKDLRCKLSVLKAIEKPLGKK